jgi:uncharacterized protein
MKLLVKDRADEKDCAAFEKELRYDEAFASSPPSRLDGAMPRILSLSSCCAVCLSALLFAELHTSRAADDPPRANPAATTSADNKSASTTAATNPALPLDNVKAPPATQPPVDQPRSADVNALAFVDHGNGKYSGLCHKIRITAGGGDGSKVRVGFFETEVSGFGDMWRAAAWSAALNAAVITDFDPRALHVAFEYEGRIDGPSAGALMTVGVLAAVRGDTVKPDIAMTGTINPDGTIGPVGGIPHKIQGAVDAGMKIVCIPGGTRYDRDMNLGKDVDLIEHGKKLGIEVIPVFDIYTAYEILTGVTLPRPPSANLPRIPLEFQKEVQEKSDEWHDLYKKALNSYSTMPGKAKLSQEAVDLYKKGLAIIQHAEQMKNEGEVSAVFWDHVHAAIYGYLALELGKCRQTYAISGYSGTVSRLRDNAWLEKEVQKTAKRLRRETPKTLDQLSMYLNACDSFIEALSLQQIAKDTLADLPTEESEEATKDAITAASHQIIAWLDLRLVGDYLDLGAAYGGRALPDSAPWNDVSDYFRRASRANMAAFDACIIKERAKASAMGPEQYKVDLKQHDLNYAMVQVAVENVFPKLNEYFGDGPAFGYGSFSTNLYLQTRSAGLLAKYYSLEVVVDEDTGAVSMSKERTLGEWLTFAEDNSRRNIARLKSAGIESAPCVQLHEIARIKSRRDLTEKLEALNEFWSCDLQAQVLYRIAGVAAKEQASP